MPDVTPQDHHATLHAIRAAQADVAALKNAGPVQNSNTGFQIAELTLASLHKAVNETRDPALITDFLNRAFLPLNQVCGGAVAPAIERARVKFKAIVETLAPKKP